MVAVRVLWRRLRLSEAISNLPGKIRAELDVAKKEIKKSEVRFSRGKINREDLYHRVMSLLEEKHLKKFFFPQIEGGKVILYLNPESWNQKRYFDGAFFLKTNLKKDDFSTTEVVKSYKELQQIE